MAWSREIAGWMLVVLGVTAFGLCYFEFLRSRKIFEAGPTAFIGFILFRGGIHLIKVAVAARICQQSAPTTPRSSGSVVRTVSGSTPKPIAKRQPRQIINQD